jgi:hypothetical protein
MNYYHPTTLEHIRNPLPAVADWATAIELPVPAYDAGSQQCMFVGGAWVVSVPAGKSDAEIIADLVADLEKHYDTTAQGRMYDNRLTCALRAGYPGPFQAEGFAFAIWMDSCNAYAYQVMQDVRDGQRDIPTGTELVAEIPVMAWPA